MSRTKTWTVRALVCAAALWTSASSAALHAQQAISGPSKVAVIDVRRILTESEVGRTALDALGEMAKGEQAKLEEMEAQIEGLQERLEAGALSLSAEKQDELRAEIQKKAIDFRRAQDDARIRVEQSQVKNFKAIEDRVMPLIAEIGEEQGFTLIFNKFEDSGLLWAEDGADITELVLERFNALPEG